MQGLQTKRPLSILTIGTEILTKDLMDQYLRSLGEISTYYGSRMEFALQDFETNTPNIIFCEKDFGDGSVQHFLEAIGGLECEGPIYFVMAARESGPELEALARELEIAEVIVKPFSAEKIREVVERAVAKLEGPRPHWAAQLKMALESVRMKRFQEAEQLYRQMAMRYPDEPAVFLAVAQFYYSKADWKTSREYLDKLGPAIKNDPRALTLLGRLYAKQGNWTEALDAWLDAQRLSPLNTERLRLLADAHLALAQELSKQACKVDECDGEAHLLILKIMASRRQYGEALSYAERRQSFISKAAPKELTAFVNLVKQLGKLK